MRLRESLLSGDNFDLETANSDLLSPSLLECDENVADDGVLQQRCTCTSQRLEDCCSLELRLNFFIHQNDYLPSISP